MKKVRILTFLAPVGAGAVITAAAFAQWHPQKSNTDASLLGLSIVNGNVVWVSGEGGTFVRTTDGGETWQAGTVAGAEKSTSATCTPSTARPLTCCRSERARVAHLQDNGCGQELVA